MKAEPSTLAFMRGTDMAGFLAFGQVSNREQASAQHHAGDKE